MSGQPSLAWLSARRSLASAYCSLCQQPLFSSRSASPLVRLMASSFVGPSGLSFQAYGRILGDAYGRSLVWNAVAGRAHDHDRARRRLSRGFRPRLCARRVAKPLLASLFLPLAASVIVKSFAWSTLMRSHGVVNGALMGLHLTSTPIRLLFTQVFADLRVREHFSAVHDSADLLGHRPDRSQAYRSGCDTRSFARARVPARCASSRCPELWQASRSSFRSPFRLMSCRHSSWARAIRPWRQQ